MKRRQIPGDMELGSMGQDYHSAAVEGVGRYPRLVEMQALLVRRSQYNLRSSKGALGQSPKSGSTAQENNLETLTAAQDGSGNRGHILL